MPRAELVQRVLITLVLTAVYGVSPVDLIPEALPFVGLVDDVGGARSGGRPVRRVDRPAPFAGSDAGDVLEAEAVAA